MISLARWMGFCSPRSGRNFACRPRFAPPGNRWLSGERKAPLHDPGFDKLVLAEMIGALNNFSDDRIPVAPKDVAALRDFFRRSVADLVSP